MYRCYDIKRFFRLLLLDSIIFALLFCIMHIGKSIWAISADFEKDKEKIFLPVIMYHSINENIISDYTVTPKQLENDLSYLYNNGFNTVTAQQLVDYVNNKCNLPKNPVMITFDDGFYNNFYYAQPLLEKYNMTAIVSIVGSYVENNTDPNVPAYSYLTWDNINDMLNSKCFEIGNHTYDLHYSNSDRLGVKIKDGEDINDYTQILNADISKLQSAMIENTGTEPIIFAYPFGYICNESVDVLKENGIAITLNCREKANYITRDADCLYSLNRYNRSSAYSTEEFMLKIFDENN